MSKTKSKKTNCLRLYRKKNGLSQKRAAYFIGFKSASSLSHYERGDKLPSLQNALKLEIVLNTPVAFLFGELYQSSKIEIRNRRDKLISIK